MAAKSLIINTDIKTASGNVPKLGLKVQNLCVIGNGKRLGILNGYAPEYIENTMPLDTLKERLSTQVPASAIASTCVALCS